MWNKLKGLIRLNLDDLTLCGGVIGGIFLLIHIITALAVKFSGEGTSLLLSGVILPIVAGVLLLILSSGHVLLTFVHAVKFGQTRKRALALTLGQVAAEALFAMGLAAALNWLERTIAPGFWKWLSGAKMVATGRESAVLIPEGYSRLEVLQIEDFSLVWYALPLIALGCVAVGLILGALIQRYGSKGGWFVWGL